jgi:hypothetical protein
MKCLRLVTYIVQHLAVIIKNSFSMKQSGGTCISVSTVPLNVDIKKGLCVVTLLIPPNHLLRTYQIHGMHT